MQDKLFLHFGPGAHSKIDQEFFKDSSIYFWDQPKLKGEANYIENLLKCTEEKIEELNSLVGKPITIIAHSFGAFLAQNLSAQYRQKISKAIYLSPTFNFFENISNMINHVLHVNQDSELTSEFEKYTETLEVAVFWEFFQKFAGRYPDYFKYYFKEQKDFHVFAQLTEQLGGVHEETLVKGASELLAEYRQEAIEKVIPDTEIFIGKYDPLFKETQIETIKKQFETKNLHILECGHYPQIETNTTFY